MKVDVKCDLGEVKVVFEEEKIEFVKVEVLFYLKL